MDALALLGRATAELIERGHAPPVIVGGAAVEYYTDAQIMTGDFDLVCPADEQLGNILTRHGFRQEDRTGHALRGFYHPQLLIAVEIVSGSLFDSRADMGRLGIVRLDDGSEVYFASIEDLIADRMGQFASSPRGVPEMSRQAILLFRLADDTDDDYLDRRISEETGGQYDLAFLKERTDADTP